MLGYAFTNLLESRGKGAISALQIVKEKIHGIFKKKLCSRL